MRYIVLIILAVSLASCSGGGENFASEIRSVDSLLTVNKNLQTRMDSIDMGKVKEEASIVKEKMETLQKGYPDTNDRNFWVQEMGLYIRVSKGFSKWQESAPGILEELKTSEHQLETLKNSLEDEKLSKEEAEKYMRREYNEFAAAQKQFYRRHGEAINAMILFPEINTRMDSVIATLPQQ